MVRLFFGVNLFPFFHRSTVPFQNSRVTEGLPSVGFQTPELASRRLATDRPATRRHF